MSRTLKVIGLIAIGAAATGLSTGYFLFAANRDRLDLAQKITAAEQQVRDLERQSEALADDAADRIEQANTEVKKAQALVVALQQEQQLFKQATPLTPSKSTQSWKEILSLPLGITVRIPISATEEQTTSIITAKINDRFDNWLQIEPFAENRLEAMRPLNASSTEDYLASVNDALLIGQRYQMPDRTIQYALRLQKNASSTHLLFLNTQSGMTEKQLLDTLSTIKTK
ncbi:MAG: hypothetical protein KC582_04205 [Candidatus Magasanikbacteria bacterium]|nr:hypothetical protein [Candidatus Magasanikbacteria bacterium]